MFRAVILGAPASGKGTISSRVVKTFGITHISSGDILRQQIQSNTALGNEAKEYVYEGKLVPDKLMLQLVLSQLQKYQTCSWLLDGFPRTRLQGQDLLSNHHIHLAIALEVPVMEIINRVKGRWVHIPSGRVYNDTFNKPKISGIDDITGEPLKQRPDDTPEGVRKRLQIYNETAQPLLSLYEEKGILKHFSGQTSDEIWPKVEKTLLSYIKPI